MSWLEANWTSREQLVWLRDAKKSIWEYFKQHYPANEPSDRVKPVFGKAMRQAEPSQFDQWMQSQDQHMMEEDNELAAYIRQGPIRRGNLNPICGGRTTKRNTRLEQVCPRHIGDSCHVCRS